MSQFEHIKPRELNKTQKEVLPAIQKDLMAAHFINSDLTPTDAGREELIDILFEEHKDKLHEKAKAYLSKHKAE